jgi:hypothetical protein
MSFLRHGQIYQSDVLSASTGSEAVAWLRFRSHRLDEFAASYSSAGWSPPEPTSALPAGFILNPPAETVNRLRRRGDYFSTGRMGNFQPVLTRKSLLQTVSITTTAASNPRLTHSKHKAARLQTGSLQVALSKTPRPRTTVCYLKGNRPGAFPIQP